MGRVVVSSLRAVFAAASVAALAVPGLVLGGCRSAPLPRDAAGTSVELGEALHGRVHPDNGDTQCFTLEGVESSLLSFEVVSDNGSMGAPVPSLSDPEGRPVDLSPFVASPQGAATLRVRSLPLRRTGIYRVAVSNTVPGAPVYYRFRYDLAFPPIEDLRLTLQPETPSPIYVAAPRGGQVLVRVRPRSGGVVPDFHGVLDPWGGRALDPSQLAPGTAVPQASRLADGTLVLNFVAPRPGVYTLLTAARSGCGGDASVSSAVTPPAGCGTRVWHTNAPCTGYGLPGETAAVLAPPCGPPLAAR